MDHIIVKLIDTNELFDSYYSQAFVSDGYLVSLVDILFTPGLQHDLYDYLNAAEIAYFKKVLEIIQS